MDIYLIGYLLILYTLNIGQVAETQSCDFPAGYQDGPWREDETRILQYGSNQINVFNSQGQTTAIFTCEDFGEADALSQVKWSYYVQSPSASPDQETCIRMFLAVNVIIRWDVPSGVSVDPPLAPDCADVSVVYTPPPSILIKEISVINFDAMECFASVVGLHQLTYDDTAGPQCVNDLGSTAEVTPSSIIINSCYTGNNPRLPLRDSATLKCAATIDPTVLDDPATETAVVLVNEMPGETHYYCARIRKDSFMRKFYMSIDYTSRVNGQVVCEQGVSSQMTEPSPIIQPDLVGLDFIALVFTPADCELGVCMNGAACTQLFNIPGYRCDCAAGFTGENCETDIDECLTAQCDIMGTDNCVDGAGTFTCNCKQGYSGTLCNAFNPCEGTNPPCQNGGTCQQIGNNQYQCRCPDNFDGVNCENELFCTGVNPCQNGGVCVEAGTGFTCTCVTGYTGNICQTELFCEPDPCVRGSCDETNNICVCPAGYTGVLCDQELVCEPNPCNNGGVCDDSTGAAVCNCPGAYTGPQCDTELPSCEQVGSDCQNGGTCESDGTCTCATGFTGNRCERVVDDDNDDDNEMLLFTIIMSIVGGLVLLAMFIWLICCCVRAGRDQPLKPPPPRSVVHAPVMMAPPTVIAAPPTQIQVIQEPQQQSIAYLVDPGDGAARVINISGTPNGVAVAPPQISLKSAPPQISFKSARPANFRVVDVARDVNNTMPKIVPQTEPIFYAPSVRYSGRPRGVAVRATSLGDMQIDSEVRDDIDVNDYVN